MARQQMMSSVNDASATFAKNNCYAQTLQQSPMGNQQFRACCGRDEEILRSMESTAAAAAAGVGDDIYNHPHLHRHPHHPHCHHRTMPPLTTLSNAKEDNAFYSRMPDVVGQCSERFQMHFYPGTSFGCENYHLVRPNQYMLQENAKVLPSESLLSHQRRHINDDSVLYGPYLSDRTTGGSSRPIRASGDSSGPGVGTVGDSESPPQRLHCVVEAGRGKTVIDGDRGHYHHHLQRLFPSQPLPANHHHHRPLGFGSSDVMMEPVTSAMASSEESNGGMIRLSSHRSYAYPQSPPSTGGYPHIATPEGSASLPMAGHPLRHQDYPATLSIIRPTDVRCVGQPSADISGRCDVVIDCQSREVEAFAEHFKQRRIRLGATQADVGAALGKLKLAGVGCLSQSTICRFESLTLSHSNMVALKPILCAWLAEMERAVRERRAAAVEAEAICGSNREVEDEDRKRKRTSIAGPEKRSLEAYFAIQPRPSGEKIAQIAEKLELRKDVVRVWFCNQRQKQKRMKFSSTNFKAMH